MYLTWAVPKVEVALIFFLLDGCQKNVLWNNLSRYWHIIILPSSSVPKMWLDSIYVLYIFIINAHYFITSSLKLHIEKVPFQPQVKVQFSTLMQKVYSYVSIHVFLCWFWDITWMETPDAYKISKMHINKNVHANLRWIIFYSIKIHKLWWKHIYWINSSMSIKSQLTG